LSLLIRNFLVVKVVDYENNVREAVLSFRSSVWEQGYGADERVTRLYGNWSVYLKNEAKNLEYLGVVNDFLSE
jgi:hypothetical protein